MDAIVAVYSDWGIGAKGTQPLVIPADRKHFRDLTQGAAVIVGRKTLGDFPGGRPLKGRHNIVVTRQEPWQSASPAKEYGFPRQCAHWLGMTGFFCCSAPFCPGKRCVGCLLLTGMG